jgi:hypothetical protein
MSAPRAKQLGVTDEQYEAMLERQGGGCAICGATPKTRRLHVDHEHRTGRVRGLLCHRCNRALPAWMTPTWLLRAFGYLLTDETGASSLPRLFQAYVLILREYLA